IADLTEAWRVHRHAVGIGADMAVEFGPATAILRPAKVEDSRPVALIDVDSSRRVVGGKRDAAMAVREVLGPWRPNRLANDVRDHLVEAFDLQRLDRIEARVAALPGVVELERFGADRLGVPQEIVDDEEMRDHGPG